MIKAVFLDVDNTLLDFHKCARTSMAQGLRDNGIEYAEEMFPVFLRLNLGFWEALERGEIDIDELYRRRWNAIFAELGIDLDGVEFEKLFRRYLAESHDAVDGALELVEYLAEKYPLYVASNAPHAQQLKRLAAAGMAPYIKEIFTSEALGYAKPDPRFFKACFEKLPGVKAEEIVFIGDSLTADIAGGIECGMKTLWFDYNATGASSPADWTVTALSDIKNYI